MVPEEINFEENHKRYAPCNACIKASYTGYKGYRMGTTIDALIDELFDNLDNPEVDVELDDSEQVT